MGSAVSAPMTDTELDAIEAEAAALPGETWGLTGTLSPTLVTNPRPVSNDPEDGVDFDDRLATFPVGYVTDDPAVRSFIAASRTLVPKLVAALRAERRKSAMLVADRGALVEERDLAARRAAEAERDLAVARGALDAERALRLREAAAHAAERVRWGDRKVELLERVVALEARAEGKQPSADVLAGELARAVARGGDATFDATAEGVAYVVTVARRDAT